MAKGCIGAGIGTLLKIIFTLTALLDSLFYRCLFTLKREIEFYTMVYFSPHSTHQPTDSALSVWMFLHGYN